MSAYANTLDDRAEPSAFNDCGTYAAYQRHRRSGEEACSACREACARYMADWRRRTASPKWRVTSRLLTDMEIAHLSGKCGEFL